MMLTIALLLSGCLVTYGQQNVVMSQGECPNVPVQNDFQLRAFQGYWNVYEAFDTPYTVGVRCVSMIFNAGEDDPRFITLSLEGFRDVSILGQTVWSAKEIYDGEGYIVDQTLPAMWSVTFGGKPEYDFNKGNFKIVSTDYSNYAILYACTKPSTLPLIVESAYVLIRHTGNPPPAVSTNKYNLQRYGVNVTNFHRMDNFNCG